MNRLVATKKFKKKADLVAQVRDLRQTVLKLGDVLGIYNSDPAAWLEQIRMAGLAKLDISAEEIDEQISLRLQARADKDFAKSDEIRDALAECGIELLDSREGTSWKLK